MITFLKQFQHSLSIFGRLPSFLKVVLLLQRNRGEGADISPPARTVGARAINPLKTEFLHNFIYKSSPYVTGNTLRLHYKAQPVNAV
jgi:hypothetical protein